jgi:Tfp pilus assembly protein PilO
MKNLPKEKRDRILLIAVGTLVILAGVYYLLITAQSDTLANSRKKKVEEELRVSNAQRLSTTVAQLQKSLDASSSRLKAIEANMASGDMYSWIILTMNSFKENGDYKLDIPQFSREVQTDVGMLAKFPYRAAVFHLRGTAYYHDFGRFIADFENAFPYIRIQNIELDPVASANANSVEEPEKLAFRMEIVTLVNPNSR